MHDYREMLSLRLGSQTQNYVKAEVREASVLDAKIIDGFLSLSYFLFYYRALKVRGWRTRLAKQSGGSEGFVILLGLSHAYDSSPPILLDLLRDPTLNFPCYCPISAYLLPRVVPSAWQWMP